MPNPNEPVPRITHYTAIGLFNKRGTACTFLMEGDKVKKFPDYIRANDYISSRNLPSNASPIEVYQE